MPLILFGKPISVEKEGGTQNSAKKIAHKTGIFGPKKPFSYNSALFGPFYGHLGLFSTLFNTQTPFLALLVQIKGGRGVQGPSLRILWQCLERQKCAF